MTSGCVLAFSLAAGQTGIAGIAFYMAGDNIDFVAAGQASQSTGNSSSVATTPDYYPNEAVDGIAIGEPAALPASSTDIAIGCRIIFRQGEAVSATIDLGQVSGRAAGSPHLSPTHPRPRERPFPCPQEVP